MMVMDRSGLRLWLFTAVLLTGLVFQGAQRTAAQDGFADHYLALYVTDNDPEKMNSALSIATNVSKFYSEKGEILEVEIIAFAAGLHMLRKDTSPVAERLQSFAGSMPNVHFVACGNTIDTMTRIEGQEPPIFEFSGHVVAGVARLMELDEAGYTIVKP
jgi:intracellular sulfur oxidation DsrE/DsrF family protein